MLLKMNAYEFMFLDPSEMKEFSTYYHDYNEDGNISFESLKEIVLSYPKFDKNLAITKLNSLYKKIKDSVSQYGGKEFYISNSF
jgi:hypothetical protein